MPDQVKKLHSALKHAGYSAIGILPGEDAAKFEKLHQKLIAELDPHGALEDEIVATVASLIWRKQNLATFRTAELARQRSNQIKQEKLPEAFLAYSVMTIGSQSDIDPDVRRAAYRAADEQARKELGEIYGLVEIGDSATIEGMMNEMDVHERLDARIDKCLKRLLFLRGLKSISLSSAPTSSMEAPRRIRAPSKAA